MAKAKSTFINLLVTLLVVTIVSATILGYIYSLTKEPIALAKIEKSKKAIEKVVPEFDNNPVEEMYFLEAGNEKFEAYPAKKQGILVGTAIRTVSNMGFSGEVWLMAGFLPDGSICDVSVLEHKETPGLGTKMEDESFKHQYRNQNPKTFNLKVKKDGGQVDGITAATISARAFSDAVQKAFNALEIHNEKNKVEQNKEVSEVEPNNEITEEVTNDN